MGKTILELAHTAQGKMLYLGINQLQIKYLGCIA
jgi:hypothetical protein